MLLSGIFLLLLFEFQFSKSSVIHKPDPSKILQAKPAPNCMNRTYCETTPYYPTDIVLEALEKNPNLQDYMNLDEMDIRLQMNNEPEEEPLCVSTEQVIIPKLAVTKNLEWKYIVNHEKFTQSVRIETCLEEDKPCRVIEGFAEGYYTKCRQKYIYRQLLAITPTGLISHEYFRFPASCCCHIDFQAYRFLRSFDSTD